MPAVALNSAARAAEKKRFAGRPRLSVCSAALGAMLLAGCSIPASGASPSSLTIPDELFTTGAGNSYLPGFSRDARGVAFVSHANNLVTNRDQGPYLNLFWRDLSAARTELISLRPDGPGGANQDVAAFAVSANGEVMAFETPADNLVSGDSNFVADIFVRDRVAGTTRLVSVERTGTRSGNGPSWNPQISSDGRYVLFESTASDLVANDLNWTNDVFIRDLLLGTTSLISLALDGVQSANGASYSPSMTRDARYVAYVSQATNVVQGVTNTSGEVYVRDRLTGSNVWAVASHLLTFRNASATPFRATQPQLSADGRFVAFKASGKVVRFDTQRATNTVRLSFPANPPIVGLSNAWTFQDNPRTSAFSEGLQASDLAMSDDGRFVVVSTGTNGATFSAVHRIDFETLVEEVMTLSTGGGGVGGPRFFFVTNLTHISRVISSNGAPIFLRAPAMSADGNRVAFLGATPDTSPRLAGVWVHDVALNTNWLVSTNRQGTSSADHEGIVPALAPDGSRVAWESLADDLIENDANRAWDVFVRDIATGDLQVASPRHSERPATTGLTMTALRPEGISADGRYLVFLSLDSNLRGSDTNGVPDAYVYDRVAGTNSLVNMARGIPLGPPFYVSNHVSHVSLSMDGRYAAFTWAVENQQPALFLGLFWRDLSRDTSRLVASGQELAPLRFGADARLVAFQSPGGLDLFTPDSNQGTDIFLRWMGPAAASPLAREIVAASTVPDNSSTGNGPSFNPSFSPDGSWLVFQSTAGDLTSTLYPRPANAQLMARRLASNPVGLSTPVRLLSYQTVGSAQPDGRSADKPLAGAANFPVFSTDSRYVVFEATPNVLYRHDLHQDLVVTITSNLVGPVLFFSTNFARVTNTLVCTGCGAPSVSGDGRLVAYESRPAGGGTTNLFLKDLVTEQTELVSATGSGDAANGSSFKPLLSHDARYVVFSSKASNLVAHDINGATDVFVRDRFAGVTMALSSSYLGQGTGNRVSSDPILSVDGRTVAFQSFAGDLVPGDYNETRDVFVLTLSGPDTDGDGLDDEWEMTYFNTLGRDGTGDWDDDGASDAAEYRAGTNPTNDQSLLRVLKLTMLAPTEHLPRSNVLLWSASPGRVYRVQTKTALEEAWLDLADTVIATTYSAQTIHTVTDALPRYYRVRLLE